MLVLRRSVIFMAIAAAICVPALSSPRDPREPRLEARPGANAAAPLPGHGYLRLEGGAIAYVPATLDRTRAAPLLVLLHGAGRRVRDMLTQYTPQADRRGVVILVPVSAGATWDMIEDHADAARSGSGQASAPRFARDPQRIDAALKDLFRHVAIDAKWIGLLGFSDGASYAIPLGMANPGLFSALMILSPGLVHPGSLRSSSMRVYVAHGSDDRALPHHYTRRTIVPALRRQGASVTFRSFSGGHVMPEAIVTEALGFFLEGR